MDYDKKMRSHPLDETQQKQLIMPRGSLKMADGRVLQPILGFDLRRIPGALGKAVMNKTTRDSVVESKGWRHEPTNFVVTAGLEGTERFGVLMHVSMSYPAHDPTWEEIKAVRALFFPSQIDAMMLLPKAGDYVNVHPHCFHLWQTPQAWDMV